MPDLEKVIRGLECHSEPHFGLDECFCETCPYDGLTCGLDVPADALKLLKAQEPIEPIIKQEMDDVCSCIDTVAYCGKCGTYIGRLKQNYCHECGHKVKWPEPPKEE